MNTSQNNNTAVELAELKAEMDGLPHYFDAETEKERNALWDKRRALGKEIRAIEKALEAEKKNHKNQVWAATSMPAVMFFDELRAVIIGGDDPPKRMPKWRLKLADDLGVEIQPKDSARVLFDCRALEGRYLDAESFTEKRDDHRQLRQLNFRILHGDGCWIFKASAGQYSSDDQTGHKVDENKRLIQEPIGARQARIDAADIRLLDLKNRIIAALTPEFCSDGIALLSQNCLICGHGLKDPVSRMRLIGPECWGKAGVNAPILIRTSDQTASDVVERRYGLRLTEAGEKMLSGSTLKPDSA